MTATLAPARWSDHAKCAGENPDWWTTEGRPMWPAAIRLCLSCPVADPCLREAVEQEDHSVIRAGMWLANTKRGHYVVSLICAHCRTRPVRITDRGRPTRYCGNGCQRAASAARRRST